MRWVVLVLALAGAGGSGFVGFIWFGDAERLKPSVTVIRQQAKSNPQAQAAIQEFDSLHKASYFLMAGAPLGIIGGLLALSRRGILAALVLLLAFAGPAVLARDWLMEKSDRMVGLGIFTGALVLAALLAFFIRPKKVIPEEERAYAGV